MSTAPTNVPFPAGSRVLVTGAGGFVGGHVARALANAGYHVRALSRKPVKAEPDDPSIEWLLGDLRDPKVREQATSGVRGVVHTAGWVSLGPDVRGESRVINVDATRALLDCAVAAGVERFVYTSTLWTVAAGTAASPADEDSTWNLENLRSPYCDTKREAEELVLERSRPGFGTVVICPGLVVGVRDVKPTSTRVLLEMSRTPVAVLPHGGIPVVDARVLAHAHIRALECAEAKKRYIVVGHYLSYIELAAIVARMAGRPWTVVPISDRWERLFRGVAYQLSRLLGRHAGEISPAAASGGFLQLHVSGARADAAFGLSHPAPAQSIYEALNDSRQSGRAPWLRKLAPIDDMTA